MDEYISCESICRSCFHSYVCQQFNEHRDDYNEKCHYFNNHFVPAADVRPITRGVWLPNKLWGENVWDCSECQTMGSPRWKFCPVCGAMMGGNNDDA